MGWAAISVTPDGGLSPQTIPSSALLGLPDFSHVDGLPHKSVTFSCQSALQIRHLWGKNEPGLQQIEPDQGKASTHAFRTDSGDTAPPLVIMELQGYLTHRKPPYRSTLQQPYA